MSYRSIQLFLLGCYLIHLIDSNPNSDSTTTNRILCYSCKGDDCQQISDDEHNVIECNRYTQLCWAGFVDQQPYRTCASRFCTPSGISLDSDVHIETCCHSNLCNNIPLSWSVLSRWYRKSTTRRPETSSASTVAGVVSTKSTTADKRRPSTTQVYVVNEIVNDGRKSSYQDSSEERDASVLSKLRFNASDPSSFGINWDRVPYEKDFSIQVASFSKLLILIIPMLLVLFF